MAKSEGMPKKAEKRRSTYKTRNWVTVVYPESEKPNWRDILRGWCVQAFVSPLHDSDKDPTGEPKKPHYHVLMMWDGPKARELMEKRVEELGGVGCQPCNSARGYARYLCHLDNPDKAQYDMGAVEAFGGADYLEVIALESDRRATIGEMMDWCKAERCYSFAELCFYAKENRPTWWQALTAHSTMIMYRFLRSLEYDAQEGERKEAEEAKQKQEPIPKRPKPLVDVPALSPLEAARKRVRDLEQRLAEARYAVETLDKG